MNMTNIIPMYSFQRKALMVVFEDGTELSPLSSEEERVAAGCANCHEWPCGGSYGTSSVSQVLFYSLIGRVFIPFCGLV